MHHNARKGLLTVPGTQYMLKKKKKAMVTMMMVRIEMKQVCQVWGQKV